MLLPNEKKEYRTKEALQKYNVEFEGEDDPESPANPEEEESSDDSECESLTPSEIREIQKQEAARLKKSPMNKWKQPPAPKDPVSNKRKSPAPVDAAERSYQTIAVACREIRARKREREALIQEVCKRLENVQLDKLLGGIDDFPSQKKLDKLEAKSTFLHKKAKKVSNELKEEKEGVGQAQPFPCLQPEVGDLRRTYRRRGQQSPILRRQLGPTSGYGQEGNSGPCGFRRQDGRAPG